MLLVSRTQTQWNYGYYSARSRKNYATQGLEKRLNRNWPVLHNTTLIVCTFLLDLRVWAASRPMQLMHITHDLNLCILLGLLRNLIFIDSCLCYITIYICKTYFITGDTSYQLNLFDDAMSTCFNFFQHVQHGDMSLGDPRSCWPTKHALL